AKIIGVAPNIRSSRIQRGGAATRNCLAAVPWYPASLRAFRCGRAAEPRLAIRATVAGKDAVIGCRTCRLRSQWANRPKAKEVHGEDGERSRSVFHPARQCGGQIANEDLTGTADTVAPPEDPWRIAAVASTEVVDPIQHGLEESQ